MTCVTTLPSAGVSGAAPVTTKTPNDYSEGYHFAVKLKRTGETVADIIGTTHEDEQRICRMNPTIEKAAINAKRVAFECTYSPTDQQIQDLRLKLDAKTIRLYQYYQAPTRSNPRNYTYVPNFSTSTREDIPTDQRKGTEYLIIQQRGEESWDEVTSLETAEQVAEKFKILELMDQSFGQKINQGLVSPEDLNLAVNDSRAAYQIGDERIQTYNAWLKNVDPSGFYHLVTKRNVIHANASKPLIEQATPEERQLIAIGVNHLFGDDGVIKLLEKDLGTDYTIERVRGSTL